MNKIVSLQETVGKGYAEFWNFKGDEVILMGSKASKKSKTTALRWAKLLKEYPRACLLATRATANTLRDSCYADMKWAMTKLDLLNEWDFITSPLQATNKYTGQKIFFRGLDDFQKIASITIDDPELVLCFGWFEEAFEMKDEETYTNIRMSLRGQLPEGYFLQTVASFNPWLVNHWLVRKVVNNLVPQKKVLDELGKQIVIKESKENIVYQGVAMEVEAQQLFLITNHKLNEFLDKNDLVRLERLKRENEKKYDTVGLGMPGTANGLVYEDVFDNNNILEYNKAKELRYIDYVGGVDYGQVESATTGMFMGLQGVYDKLVIFDEYYHSNFNVNKKKEITEYAADLVNFFQAKHIEFELKRTLLIYVDNATPGFIQLLNQEAKRQKAFMLKFVKCWKMKVKERQDITKGLMAQKKWLVTDHCVNYISEVENCEYESGKEVRKKDPAHAIDGSEYGATPYLEKILKRGEINENDR